MARYIPDQKSRRWVIIAPTRSGRPDEKNGGAKPTGCVFCTGNESMTPPEVYRIGDGQPNTPGWKVRVVPNKYPITDIHEVIIHSPDHTHDLEDLPIEQVELIMKTYFDRYHAHKDKGHVLIFCNHGQSAGASLVHPHSQLVVVPHQITIDILEREPVTNVIEESDRYIVYCPDFSQWPYEVWIGPKENGRHTFGDCNEACLKELAAILKRTLLRLRGVYQLSGIPKINKSEAFTYNFYIYHDINWYIRIIPRLVHRAGFELGTGLSVNVTDPKEAAIELKIIQINF